MPEEPPVTATASDANPETTPAALSTAAATSDVRYPSVLSGHLFTAGEDAVSKTILYHHEEEEAKEERWFADKQVHDASVVSRLELLLRPLAELRRIHELQVEAVGAVVEDVECGHRRLP